MARCKNSLVNAASGDKNYTVAELVAYIEETMRRGYRPGKFLRIPLGHFLQQAVQVGLLMHFADCHKENGESVPPEIELDLGIWEIVFHGDNDMQVSLTDEHPFTVGELEPVIDMTLVLGYRPGRTMAIPLGHHVSHAVCEELVQRYESCNQEGAEAWRAGTYHDCGLVYLELK